MLPEFGVYCRIVRAEPANGDSGDCRLEAAEGNHGSASPDEVEHVFSAVGDSESAAEEMGGRAQQETTAYRMRSPYYGFKY